MAALQMLRNFHPLRRLCTAVWDLVATAFYLLAAKFMRKWPRLARPVVYHCLYAYFLLKGYLEEHPRTIRRAGQASLHFLCAVVLPFVLLWLSQTITLQSFAAAWQWIFAHKSAAFLTCLFLSAVQLFSFSLLRSYAPGSFLSAFLVAGISLVNHYKTVLNGFPLMLCDFSLFSGLGDIIAYAMPEIHLSSAITLPLLLFLAAGLFAAMLSRKIRKSSITSFVACSLAFPLLLAAFGPGAFSAQAAQLTEHCATQEERLAECGVLGGLYGAYTNSQNADHSAYNSDNINRLNTLLYLEDRTQDDAVAPGNDASLPHIIFILSESFFDVTRYEDIHFSVDPIPVFHTLSEKHTNGRFISSTYAGGTGYVELEVLTGLNNYAVDEKDTLCSLKCEGDDIYTHLPSVARDLSQGSGYQTLYIHSHSSALYDRAHIMDALGFDEVIFAEDFETDAFRSGHYVSDEALANEVIHRFEQRKEGHPLFLQVTTMENHRPYTTNRYGDAPPIEFSCDALDAEEQDVLSVYLQGLNHADAALGQLVDYFDSCGEPVMLVFYGDHLPTMQMSDTSLLYATLGRVASNDSLSWSPEELKEMLSTDYLIWTNYEDEPQPDRTESSLFLGVNALHRARVERSAFFRWLSDEASREYLAARSRLFVAADGTSTAEPAGSGAELLRDHNLMTYDLLYGEQFLLRHFTVDNAAKP